jgi:hypothetical protein
MIITIAVLLGGESMFFAKDIACDFYLVIIGDMRLSSLLGLL